MSKALGLFSGGLDSILAAETLKRQGVEVTGIAFVTPFFDAEKALKTARLINIPLIVRDIGAIHLDMVKNPRYGYGKNMNPCIDCHAMMFRLAGEILEEEGFDFLFSGEVLGQRPMSQNRSALQAVAKHSGVGEKVLRPLSARLLPVTPMEEQGLVDREQLLDIQGRTRRRQEELARMWGIADYPSPGGGCLLTEKSFSERLKDLFTHQPDATVVDVELLKAGRQFRLSPESKLTLARNKAGNEMLKNLLRPEDILVRILNVAGPLGVVSGQPGKEDLATAATIVAAYGKGQHNPEVEALLQQNGRQQTLKIVPAPREKTRDYIIK